MAQAKYKEYFTDMVSSHQDLFSSFKKVHDAYAQDESSSKEAFNRIGQEVLDVIRKYDNMLCSSSEGGKYGKFSSKLSDKFWNEVRLVFPKIDFVGME